MLQYSCGIHSESRIGEYFSIILSHKKSFLIILFVYFPSSNLVCSFFFFFIDFNLFPTDHISSFTWSLGIWNIVPQGIGEKFWPQGTDN